jgi:hypothetical protein
VAGAALSPQEQARFEQLIARARQLQAAGEPIPPGDAAELAAFQARGGGPQAAPLSAQEQARYQQLVARAQQLQAAGEPIPPGDAAELQGFVARGAPSPAAGAYGGGKLGDGGGGYTGPGYTSGPIDQYGNPIAAPGAGGNQQIGITDPGYAAPTPDDRYGAMTGVSKPAIPQAAYGSAGDDMLYAQSAQPTTAVYGGPAVSATVGPQGYAMPSWYTQQAAGQSQYPSQDPRQKQAAMLAKALPPSPYDGLNDQDTAALKGMEAIYKQGGQGIAGGEYERLKASGRLGFMQSAGRLLGYDPKELESQYAAYRPSQGSSRMAG